MGLFLHSACLEKLLLNVGSAIYFIAVYKVLVVV